MALDRFLLQAVAQYRGFGSMIADSDVSAILAAVDAKFDEQIRFTQDFVRIPSLRGEERNCAGLHGRGHGTARPQCGPLAD